MSTTALILAAGEPRQMDHFQPMLKLSGKSVIRRQIESFRAAGVEDILIVTGYHAGMLERHLSGETVRFVKNEDYASTDMMASVQCGVRALGPSCERVLITPGDVPYLHPETIEKLLRSPKPVAIPSYRGSAGHPAMVRRAFFSALLGYQGERGLRGALAQWKKDTEFVPTDENGMLIDINTEQDYRREQREQTPPVSPVLSAALTIQVREACIDERSIRLLECIELEQSLQRGAARAELSYSNAWLTLNRMEEALGCRLVERKLGGATGGGSSLTEDGRAWVERYRRLEQRLGEDLLRIQTDEFDKTL
ncbi:MAG: NTP transferase domain-containing protein [Clostridiales bacterium]|nr:NTP transferase domain-containing protein [Clostridiales bacterium]